MKNGTCRMPSLVLDVNECVQASRSPAVLPLARQQCSIHCESSRVAEKYFHLLPVRLGQQELFQLLQTRLELKLNLLSWP